MKDALAFLISPHADSYTITTVQLVREHSLFFFATLVMLWLSDKHTF